MWNITVTPRCLLEIVLTIKLHIVRPYILWANGMKGRHTVCLTFRISAVSTGALKVNNMQGYYHLNTTILSDTYEYLNYMFRPLWPS